MPAFQIIRCAHRTTATGRLGVERIDRCSCLGTPAQPDQVRRKHGIAALTTAQASPRSRVSRLPAFAIRGCENRETAQRCLRRQPSSRRPLPTLHCGTLAVTETLELHQKHAAASARPGCATKRFARNVGAGGYTWMCFERNGGRRGRATSDVARCLPIRRRTGISRCAMAALAAAAVDRVRLA